MLGERFSAEATSIQRHRKVKTGKSKVQSCPVPHPWDRENYRSTLRFKDGLVVQNEEKVKR